MDTEADVINLRRTTIWFILNDATRSSSPESIHQKSNSVELEEGKRTCGKKFFGAKNYRRWRATIFYRIFLLGWRSAYLKVFNCRSFELAQAAWPSQIKWLESVDADRKVVGSDPCA